ncbi:N-acetylglucosamine-specific PTS transporter subunit IIBC [Microbacterium sp. EYE_5]|uniref:N-acetylglucosamine-specific PTS transporter subunit IIBC n=1 Tax=unclassified Microbacterium TaxID=2609290 RepID=UPI002002CF75|nr:MULTISPECIES: N-acetylglucosamine-specific PTS transporter subunit IIBC [unclassified Microbacterium]MCK6080589.1 N-acetylglucosamine-specific PTS transporter subunit IIBC [Microbacterium sp. EYE_382]MCK6085860.1 N-acetylglucosamine-specific PTS transporter subunit IIBC [Microbacterium sp. EYE_384]MCK6124642.1 N-acetylglucosamine-specific PTS transporter subunit IIBC [Microbacterium sp. EYE_80]MCK6127551.1 N-acetylglucosamine-specific PTS transporter subunit IIBC [Microbacterium sp. EYE_79]
MKFFQRLGRSLMLPVAVLPVAAILSGIGYWIKNANGGSDNIGSAFLSAAGGALLNNLALLFAVGVSIGMAKKSDGTSALAGLVSWLTVTTMLSPATMSALTGVDVEAVDPAFTKVQNVFVGIICGLIGAWCYNRFKDTKLPDALSFFSGKRSVAIVTAGLSLIVAIVLVFLWPLVYGGLVSFGEWIVTLGPVGAGLYGFFNRLLIPLGLHHALNSVFWFDVAGINDLNNFLQGSAGDGVAGETGQYMTGFFPVMMFGLPGAALAMYVTAKTTRRKVAAGILLSGAISSFFVGVTEPLEFSFMFLAPWLYLVHAVFMGISLFVSALLPVRMGFGFSGGFIDLVLGWVNPLAQNPWIILIMGPIWFVIYFVVFRWIIRRFDLKTPGREDDEAMDDEETDAAPRGDFHTTAERFVDALGGKDNIVELDNCATRLRMEIADVSRVDESALRRAGAAGTIKPGGRSVQVVYGLNVQFVKDAMEDVIAGRSASSRVPAAAGVAIETQAPAVVRLTAPVAGRILALSDVPDAMFSDGTMGPGIAIDPSDEVVTAPADGMVESVFPTGHAVGLRLDDGTELLIHIGIDTVEMQGDGFRTLVSAGQRVKTGDPLVRFDRQRIVAAGHSPVTPVVILNNPDARIDLV